MPIVQFQKQHPRKSQPTAGFVQPPTPRKPVPGRGRPCLLTKDREALLLKAIEDGLPLKQAAMLAGISYDSLNRWRTKGESDSAPFEFRQFCKALQHSEAIAMQRLLGLVQQAGEADWKAASWMLERRFPEEFSKPQRVEHSGPEGKPIEAVGAIEPEVLRRDIQRLCGWGRFSHPLRHC